MHRSLNRLLQRDGIVSARRIGPSRSNPSEVLVRMAVRFAGRVLDLTVRQGTTDVDLIGMILCRQSVYALPQEVQPKVIFDVGANIGIAAVYYSVVYPKATVYCFEPLPANIELLCANASRNSDRIRVIRRGLSDVAGSFEYHMSGNRRSYGGGTFCQVGSDPSRAVMLPVGTVRQAIEEAAVDQVDVFKIDTEGSEWRILRGIDDQMRPKVQAYTGELHGVNDWEFCRLLAQSHAIDIHKRYDRNCFPVMAVRKDLVSQRRIGPSSSAPAVAA